MCKKVLSGAAVLLGLVLLITASACAAPEKKPDSTPDPPDTAQEKKPDDTENPLDTGKEILYYLFWSQDAKLEEDIQHLQEDLSLTDSQMEELKELGLQEHLATEELDDEDVSAFNAGVDKATEDRNAAVKEVLGDKNGDFRTWIADWWELEREYRMNLSRPAPEASKVWYSENHTKSGYIKDTSSPGRLQVVISDEETSNDTIVSLSDSAVSVENIRFISEDKAGVEGHINPSTNVFQIFALQTGELLEQYYGYGFTYADGVLYYIQAPQHFSEITGHNRILTSEGNLLYESDEGIIISDSLEIKDNSVIFYEKGLEDTEWRENACNTADRVRASDDIYYYN